VGVFSDNRTKCDEHNIHGDRMQRLQALAIRVFDLVLIAFSLVILLPLFVVVALAIKTTSPGPVFFRQVRLGVNGRLFRIFKFRTMVDGSEHTGMGMLTAHDDDRITPVGKILRDWSIDELPQVLNVIKGEMSLVGPRPAIVEYLDQYDTTQARRLLVPPGLTGWAQVNGRNSLTWPERIERDLWYVDRRSLLLNARIVAKTIPVLFKREGVYGPPQNFDMTPAAGKPGPFNRNVAG
jgi:lipopolysaccharide/colanic/teichoic acid biosynthesis glycosyltransferase